MLPKRVLLLSHNPVSPGDLKAHFAQQGIELTVAESIETTLLSWEKEPCDLLIIEEQLPDLAGITTCRRLRQEGIRPILLLPTHDDDDHLLALYQAGADECVGPAIGPALLLAKVIAWLHRAWTVAVESLEPLHVGELVLDPNRHMVVTADGARHSLSNLEFRLLHLLMSHPGQVLAAVLVVDLVWGDSHALGHQTLADLVRRLGEKIEPDPTRPRYIQAVAGVGYAYQPR